MTQVKAMLPHIRWGKTKARSQMAEIFTDDGRIIVVEIPVLRGCMSDDRTASAFLLDADNQFVNEDGVWVQVLGERSTIPISLIRETEYKELQSVINQIYHEAAETEKQRQYEKLAENRTWNRIMWLVLGPLGLLTLAYLVTLVVK